MFEELINSDSTVGESPIVHINWKVYEKYAFHSHNDYIVWI